MKLVIRLAIVLMLSVLAVPAALACGNHAQQASNTEATTTEEPAAVEATPTATTEAAPAANPHSGCSCNHAQAASAEAQGAETTTTTATEATGGDVTCPFAHQPTEQATTPEAVPGS